MDELIFSYTHEDALADGIFVQLGNNLYMNTETAVRLAPSEEGAGIAMSRLFDIVRPILEKYNKGIYYDEGVEYPEEMDAHLSMYKVTEANGDEQWLWLEGGVFFFPEYR